MITWLWLPEPPDEECLVLKAQARGSPTEPVSESPGGGGRACEARRAGRILSSDSEDLVRAPGISLLMGFLLLLPSALFSFLCSFLIVTFVF